MNRRTFLGASTAFLTTAAAGCLDQALGTPPRAPPTVSGRPDAVYVPSHAEGMKMLGMKSAGEFKVGLMYSYAHRFWNITGSNLKKAEPSGDVHLMASVWDPDTKTVLPVGNARLDVTKDGDNITGKRMWPMLSQNMGFHFGDNVALDGDGSYKVTAEVDPLGATTAGAFEGKFGDAASATFAFDYSKDKRDEIEFNQLDNRKGKKAALNPMDMMMPISRVPERSNLPGDPVGQGTAGDAVFYVRSMESPPSGVAGDGPYLYVSPRTPYNRYPLPFMSITATVENGGSTIFDDGLGSVIHPKTGYHYGVALDDLPSGADVTLSFGAPPQVARHEGYETAFMSFEDLSMTV